MRDCVISAIILNPIQTLSLYNVYCDNKNNEGGENSETFSVDHKIYQKSKILPSGHESDQIYSIIRSGMLKICFKNQEKFLMTKQRLNIKW